MNRAQLISMCTNNVTDGNDGVPVWSAQQKRVASAAERAGLVTVERTDLIFGGLKEWRVRLVGVAPITRMEVVFETQRARYPRVPA